MYHLIKIFIYPKSIYIHRDYLIHLGIYKLWVKTPVLYFRKGAPKNSYKIYILS